MKNILFILLSSLFTSPAVFAEIEDRPACFAACVAEFGSMIQKSDYVQSLCWANCYLANSQIDDSSPFFEGVVRKTACGNQKVTCYDDCSESYRKYSGNGCNSHYDEVRGCSRSYGVCGNN